MNDMWMYELLMNYINELQMNYINKLQMNYINEFWHELKGWITN